MNAQEYLKELEKHLKKLPPQDYKDAMEYFTEYFSETDEAGAQQLMAELGSPKDAARDLIANLLDKKITDDHGASFAAEPHRHSHILWLACLAILAAPIGLPLSIIRLLILLVFILCAAVGLICWFLVSTIAVLCGCKLLAGGIALLTISFPGFALQSGRGLLMLGGSILDCILGYYICKGIGIGFIKLAQKISKKGGFSVWKNI